MSQAGPYLAASSQENVVDYFPVSVIYMNISAIPIEKLHRYYIYEA